MNTTLNVSERRKAQFIETGLTAAMDMTTVNRLMECASFINAAPPDLLFLEGDPARYFYSVVTGYVRLFRQNNEGREGDIRICGPGDTFGDDLVFSGDTCRYSAQAAENATLVCYDLAKVRQIAANDDGSMARVLAMSLATQLQQAIDCVADDRLNTALQRVAHYLLSQCPGDTAPASFRLACRKSLLAGKLGLAPEALSRAFGALKTLGVNVHGRTIEITDIEALKRL
ncbi:Crp/Fnr family transcriptional regulator [Martelella mediterranea]|uniref:cAMP regulatory protein n=1 Tax=Martelella mediterranea DSM 17316 TaxID=1122214 RepID=A0A1U9YZ67_9HYPH|nr:Crp/Fnr family transcriptional regulator [Martelella mediterranea]AQZ50652.1 cAMP regulatory protein [Martelella mediterranea DSM 17316]